VVGGERHGDVLPVGCAFRAQVDHDIEDGAAADPDQLRFDRGGTLEVQPSHGPLLVGEPEVRLGDHGLQPMLPEFALTEGAREEAAIVLARVEGENERAPQPGLGEDHLELPPLLPGARIFIPRPSSWRAKHTRELAEKEALRLRSGCNCAHTHLLFVEATIRFSCVTDAPAARPTRTAFLRKSDCVIRPWRSPGSASLMKV